jgi:hypothetical protein
VAIYPIATPRGLLDRDQLKATFLIDRERTLESTPASQKFETLDQFHCLCIETWMLRDSEQQLKRWTRLVKEGSAWLIDSVEEGSAE